MSEEISLPPPKVFAHAMGPALQEVQQLSTRACKDINGGKAIQSGIAAFRNNKGSVKARCDEGLRGQT